ncbi:MAG: hypothetical protein ACFFDI_28620 [Promethearchaeota archaeon]
MPYSPLAEPAYPKGGNFILFVTGIIMNISILSNIYLRHFFTISSKSRCRLWSGVGSPVVAYMFVLTGDPVAVVAVASSYVNNRYFHLFHTFLNAGVEA